MGRQGRSALPYDFSIAEVYKEKDNEIFHGPHCEEREESDESVPLPALYLNAAIRS
jgi:hypothetical protein